MGWGSSADERPRQGGTSPVKRAEGGGSVRMAEHGRAALYNVITPLHSTPTLSDSAHGTIDNADENSRRQWVRGLVGMEGR